MADGVEILLSFALWQCGFPEDVKLGNPFLVRSKMADNAKCFSLQMAFADKSAADCSISLRFSTEFYNIKGTQQMVMVQVSKGNVTW